MPKHIAKSDLPRKTCAHCNRPFAWRRKWARVWDEVKYCSDRCRADSRRKPAVG
ncbi:MAG: DUF2256 domain-containing protein [Hoeflea sp.]|uniref:DUF2256 domain-containing protein n=1 Tax=Hoeflea sp. TaxID=1940281 RepID=UPI0027311D58|nr:DUF2256 domain-containing protein [Hoeflea sp.]MDP2119114.1 DUF2256 domain-containing protein [Hoeflea sp.]